MSLTLEQQHLNDLWEEHLRHEFQTRDPEATLRTMVPDAYVNHVLALVVIVHFRNGNLAHEHIYWDQASVLVQLGRAGSVGPSGRRRGDRTQGARPPTAVETA